MIAKAAMLWVAGLLTIVPYGTYYLFVHAERDQYAFLIVMVLFWIFGYWGVAGPLICTLKVRAVFGALEQAQSQAELRQWLQSAQTEDVLIELIARDNHIPRFLAAHVYRMLARRLR